jgi:hypothetical protein
MFRQKEEVTNASKSAYQLADSVASTSAIWVEVL